MKYLILVRHGKDKIEGDLSDEGKEQIARLTDSLKSIIPAGSIVKVLTSRITRARQSAELIMGNLNLSELNEAPILSSNLNIHDPKIMVRLRKFAAFVKKESARVDVLILVTHFPQTELFPPYYGSKVVKTSGFLSCGAENGEAVLICCEEKSCRLIPAKQA